MRQWRLHRRQSKITGVKVNNAFLANHAEIRESLAYVSGAFPEWWEVFQLPATANVFVVFVVELDDDELQSPIECVLDLEHPGGTIQSVANVLVNSSPRGERVTGAPNFQIVAVSTLVEFLQSDRHEFTIRSGEERLARVPFAVRVKPQPAGTAVFTFEAKA
jgi:hypothetical protein